VVEALALLRLSSGLRSLDERLHESRARCDGGATQGIVSENVERSLAEDAIESVLGTVSG